MAPHAGLIDTLFDEMKGRIQEDDASVPVKDGDYFYWRSFEKGAQYRKWWRKPVAGGPDELLVDEPAMAQGHDYFRLGTFSISENDRFMAYSTDTDGSERYIARIRDLYTGAELPDVLEGTMGALVWSKDGAHILYGKVNDQWRIDKIIAHRIGTTQADDVLLYEEPDIGFQAGVGLTHARDYVVIATGDNSTNEVRLLRADHVLGAQTLVRARQPGLEYGVELHEDMLYIVTNDTHTNFRLVTAPLSAPADWHELIAPCDDFYLQGVSAFRDFFVVEGRKRGLDQIWLHQYAGGARAVHQGRQIDFPEASYSAGLDENPEYAVDTLRLSYESMVTPDRVVDYDVATGAMTVRKEQVIPSGYAAADYATERLEIEARDGTPIPVSIVHRAGLPRDGSAPLYLYGYGAYGISIDPGFSTNRLSLLDRGFAYAIAHIRGGDDLGQQWQRDGKLTKRWNTFNDFMDVARGLIERGYTAAGKIVAAGGSAGGELMGVALNEAPVLFGAVAAHVPFVDVLNTMLDDSLPLTPGEWTEWGNPITDREAFDLIRSYSPYDNVRVQAYPPLMVTAGLNDPRVTYWEPAKWVAKLRATKTDANPLILKTNMGAGHGGKSGRWESLRESAEEMAFFLSVTGGAAS
ncbi:MAG: S9 family peptidase, partial [Alphaproteobacteria bacterium]|nr:S9 family peptidase [Alphaproteobacteria bacterium]